MLETGRSNRIIITCIATLTFLTHMRGRVYKLQDKGMVMHVSTRILTCSLIPTCTTASANKDIGLHYLEMRFLLLNLFICTLLYTVEEAKNAFTTLTHRN